ncbi:TPA: hypothetical protein QCY66_004757 [Bacillus cereus]|nr:hypothetical protein [Bacillus cereus]
MGLISDWIWKKQTEFVEKHGSLPEFFSKKAENHKTIDANYRSKHSGLKFEPAYGALVYTELLFGLAEHSGIYIGNKKIINLDGKGRITKVSCNQFTENISTFNHEIYVPCYDGEVISIGFYRAGSNAEEKLSQGRKYNLLFDNCHQFSAGCITGDFENSSNFLSFVKEDFKRALGGESIVWRKWDWKNN